MFFRKKQTDCRFIIAGLGNPGKKYQNTRHNVGFLALDYIAKANDIRLTRRRFSAVTGEGRIDGAAVTLIKPTTYMNLSGQAVFEAARYYGVLPARIIVICDDAALAPGIIRIREGGSSGGQKGLISIENMLNSREYIRIRIGIGDGKGNLADYVLSAPSDAEQEVITARFSDVAKAVEMITRGDISGAQSRFNGIR